MNKPSASRLVFISFAFVSLFGFCACSRKSSPPGSPSEASGQKESGKDGNKGPSDGKGPGQGQGMGKPGARTGSPQTVAIATVKTGSFPVLINALGTATAWNTVTVKSRVDGTLVKLNFSEGSRVKAGDLLAEIDPRPYQVQLEQAEGQLARDQALLENAKLDLQRYMIAREAVTQQQVDTARSNVGQYEGAVQIDKSSIDNAKLQLDYCRITSPIDGITGLRLIDQGNLVQASGSNNSIVVVAQDDPIAVTFNVPEDNLPTLRRATSTGEPLVAEAFDRTNTKPLGTGKVTALDNQIDTTTGTVRIKACFENANHKLYPNQFVNVRLLVETKKDVLLVPVTAVQINDAARFVFVVKENQTIEQRTVQVGLSDSTNSVILSGVSSGENVIIDGLDRLRNGDRVIVRGAEKETKTQDSKKQDPR